MTATLTPEVTKRCSGCTELKPVDDFHRDRLKRDGRASRCKDCRRRHLSIRNPAPRCNTCSYGICHEHQVPSVCVCDIARRGAWGECQSCHRPIVAFMSDHRRARERALERWPELANQVRVVARRIT
jgi:hypothetical protein